MPVWRNGRRARLKIEYRKMWRFESSYGYFMQEANEPNLIGIEVHGYVLKDQLTTWQRSKETGVGMARFSTTMGRKVIIVLSPMADGSEWIEAHPM